MKLLLLLVALRRLIATRDIQKKNNRRMARARRLFALTKALRTLRAGRNGKKQALALVKPGRKKKKLGLLRKMKLLFRLVTGIALVSFGKRVYDRATSLGRKVRSLTSRRENKTEKMYKKA